MRYESEILYDLMKRDGLLNPSQDNLPYESELKEKYVNDVVGAYPKLQDYRSEWLNYAFEEPIGEFPYVTLTDVTNATIENVVPYAYKSAILKGQTLVNLLDAEILKGNKGNINVLFNVTLEDDYFVSIHENGQFQIVNGDGKSPFEGVFEEGKTYTLIIDATTTDKTGDGDDVFLELNTTTHTTPNLKFNNANGIIKRAFKATKRATPETKSVFKIGFYNSAITKINRKIMLLEGDYTNVDIPYFEGMQSVKMPVLTTSNEDGTKTNILTVNEEVELRGIGVVNDELNLITSELTQRIGEVVLDGSEEWGISTNFSNGDCKAYSLSVNGLTSNIVCDGLKIIPNSVKYGTEEGVFVSGNLLIIKKNIATRELLKQWLSQNPITVQYQLATESVKIVDLTILDQNGSSLSQIKPIEGTMYLSTSGKTIKPLFSGEIPVEAITQNLETFIEE